MTYNPAFAGTTRMRPGGMVVVLAATTFLLGLAAGARVRPSLAPQAAAVVAPATQPRHDGATRDGGTRDEAAASMPAAAAPLVYPVEVVRIIDGDTFEANVHVWPGLTIDTKVRLRDIDAPELHARCADEYAKADAARAALTRILARILAEGGVAISKVGIDKYGGRVDAAVETRSTADVSAALLSGGFARAYDGGRRGGWC
jgi:endonuclease YncB( thermonuclease family)